MKAPDHIVNYRREQCVSCKFPCQYRDNLEYRTEGDNACPSGRWMSFMTYPKHWRGAGDAVASVAQPIAGAIDKVFKTNVKGCGACAKRRELFNKWMPFPNNKNTNGG